MEKYEICRALFYLPPPPPGQYCVYALLCDDGSIYIGQTSDLAKRYREHQAGRATDWTRRHKPLRIAYIETTASRQEAMKLEYRWKARRQRLKRLVAKEIETLRQAVADLSGAYAQALPHPKAQEIREDLELFQAACAAIAGSTRNTRPVT
jgi:putative endonuclease